MDKIKTVILEIENIKSTWNYKDAEKKTTEAIIKYSDDYRLYEELADINLYVWDNKKASKAIDFALELWDNKKASKAIDFALELNSESATWNYLKWFSLLSANKIKEAISYLEKSNKLLWNNSEVLRNLGWAYTMIWESEKGISILKRALILAPSDELIKEDLAMALIWSWDIKEWNSILKEVKNTKKVS